MAKKITPKSTKPEIYEAYEQLLKDNAKATENQPQIKKEVEMKTAIVEKVKEMTMESLISTMADSKVQVMSTMESLMAKLNNEVVKFNEVQQAIEFAREELKTVHNVTNLLNNIQSLEDMRDQKSIEIQAEIDNLQVELEKKAVEQREQYETYKRNRKRDEEQFDYDMRISQRNTKTEYELKIKNYQDQLKDLEDKQAYFQELEAARGKFDEEKALAVNEAAKNAEETQIKKNGYKIREMEHTYKSAIALKDQTIETQTAKIDDLVVAINELKERNKELMVEVSGIAKASIDGASKSASNINVTTSDNKK